MAKITDSRFLTPAELHVRAVPADDQGSGASGAYPCAAREADVTSQPGVVPDSANPDVVLVGGGIMSATLAALIGVVAPQWSVTVFESAADVAGESSQAWNNAGTGHSALCELNYTPAGPDGRVDPAKAVTINEQFQVSRQFWSHLVRGGPDRRRPRSSSPRSRTSASSPARTAAPTCGPATEALAAQPLFDGLEYSRRPGRARRVDPADDGRPRPAAGRRRDPRRPPAPT